MANTEGLSDEALSSMLAMPSPDEEKRQRATVRSQHGARRANPPQPPSFPRRSLARREEMMELGDGEAPSAAVVRSSTAPKVHFASSTKKVHKRVEVVQDNDEQPEEVGSSSHEHVQKLINDQRVILSEYIRERPMVANNTIDTNSSSSSSIKPRESRFKQRNSNKNNGLGIPTSGGFPSLDIAPVGTLTRRGRPLSGVKSTSCVGGTGRVEPQTYAATKGTKPASAAAGNYIGVTSDSMLSNMSPDEIREGVEEIKSILSSASIEFLKRRGRQKRATSTEQSTHQYIAHDALPIKQTISEHGDVQLEEKRALEKKEKLAVVLSAVRTPEDLDRVYNESLQTGLATELPSSTLGTVGDPAVDEDGIDDRMKNLHTATSLLRSTAPRQRLLGAKCLIGILEEDVNELEVKRSRNSFSDAHDERETMRQVYPPLLPVALRCLLDESIATYQTPGGKLLLLTTLRCIHALMTLFVHPYHVICLNTKSMGWNDPFVLYQTCFLSDISHVPPSTELYPPTKIQPLEIEGVGSTACYKADSSAATAVSDSKAFYLDPAWTLLSRMHLLPCLADVVLCLSADYRKGVALSESSIRSICGILAMLTVRSPGAASAIARHKDILPFLISYCLSPSDDVISNECDPNNGTDEMNDDLFNAELAMPALMLLCQLARQSRDIAELEMPFQTIMPYLQAILSAEAESEIQTWSLILLRILMRYGIAIEHVQSLISIAAPKVEMMRSESRSVAHYLTFFATICDASKRIQQNENGQTFSTSDADGCLAMTGVWLSASVRNCFAEFRNVVKRSGIHRMKLAAAQLRLMSSFTSTAMPTMGEHSVPIVPNDSCLEVINAALKSEMLNVALTKALATALNASWQNCTSSQTHSLEEEAIGCLFVSAFMNLVRTVGDDINIGMRSELTNIIINFLERLDGRSTLAVRRKECSFHPVRQSWFIEAEFSVLSFLCDERLKVDVNWPMLSSFAFSLLGRMNVGHESLAEFVFGRHNLFILKDTTDHSELSCQSIQTLFQRELTFGDRALQLIQSSNLFFMRDLYTGSTKLESLRCTADFASRSNSGEDKDRFFLPMGDLWMWNVLSSSTSSQLGLSCKIAEADNDALLDVLSHTLHLLLQLEVFSNESFYVRSIESGSKLYHLANVCLLPEFILSDSDICVTIDLMFRRFTGFEGSVVADSSLIKGFVKSCFEHSRISKESKSQDDESLNAEHKLNNLLINPLPSHDGYSKDELKALDDFADDLCNAYIEYGGQYPAFTNFIRLFLRHDFPAKVTNTVLTKLHPILHVLSIDGEDIKALQFSLAQSISGALPSLDSSRRDPSSVLDSYSSALKKKDKVLLRNDYVYLMAIAVLSRNLASSSQRCECGLVAMKNRLTGVSDAAFYDIVLVAEKILLVGAGTRELLITCLMDICMDSKQGLIAQDETTRNDWIWSSDKENVWTRVVESLRASSKG